MSGDESNRTCPKCGARWLGDQLYWATGKKGDPRDLAGLVCRPYGDDTCINEQRAEEGGDTWEKRKAFMEAMDSELNT
jgi:hypothetical protein